jgi:hypothetical protein
MMTGTKIKMIGITQDDLSAHLSELIRRDAFHRSRRSNRHEHRSQDLVILTFVSNQSDFTRACAFNALLVGERMLKSELKWTAAHRYCP